MDIKLVESYLENLEELIHDENKIVTYKSLSKSLGIHVNTAKQLLHSYLSKEKSKNSSQVSATYLLAGKLKDSSFNISIVNEVDLDSAYSKFVEITSEHVYSIHKGKTVREVNVLYGVDKDLSDVESPAVIKCSKSVLKSIREVEKKADFKKDESKKIIENALAPERKPSLVETSKKTESSTSSETTSKSPKKNISPKQSSKGGLAKAQADSKKPMGNIANLFAKASQKKAENAAKNKSAASENKQKQEQIESTDVSAEIKEVSAKSEKSSLERVKESNGGSKGKKSGGKRKRIQMLSDSDGSSSDDEKELSPVEEVCPLPLVANVEEDNQEPKESFPRNKRKKRKVVDRTVMNEDGYLETKKEVVFETDSEDEVEQEKKINDDQKKAKFLPVTDKGKGLQSASAAKKQSSLLTFFKKS